MGLTAERLAKPSASRASSRTNSPLQSHQKARRRDRGGRFDDEIVPVPVSLHDAERQASRSGARRQFKIDEGPRADTSLEALLALKAAFHAKGTVTAGNSSQMSDGAAAAVVMSAERAQGARTEAAGSLRRVLLRGVQPEEMGLGPVFAIPKVLKLAGLKLEDIDLFELNEAFAAQSLAVLQEADSIRRAST